LARTEALLGSHLVQVQKAVIDPLHSLRLADVQLLERLIDDFERRFPRVTFSVFVGDLPGGLGVSEAAVWLLNHAVIERRGTPMTSSWGILLVINPQVAQAGLAVGYALECVLPFGVLQSLLNSERHHLWHREFERSVRGLLDGIESRLRAVGAARRRVVHPSPVRAQDHLGLPKAGTLPPQRIPTQKTFAP
jgi:hypothetical protein